jgi:hypothetical protein
MNFNIQSEEGVNLSLGIIICIILTVSSSICHVQYKCTNHSKKNL